MVDYTNYWAVKSPENISDLIAKLKSAKIRSVVACERFLDFGFNPNQSFDWTTIAILGLEDAAEISMTEEDALQSRLQNLFDLCIELHFDDGGDMGWSVTILTKYRVLKGAFYIARSKKFEGADLEYLLRQFGREDLAKYMHFGTAHKFCKVLNIPCLDMFIPNFIDLNSKQKKLLDEETVIVASGYHWNRNDPSYK